MTTEVAEGLGAELSAEKIREQLELLINDQAFRSSKRSVQFLCYVVEQTLTGCADQIKERTIGVEVFGREPSYDTNVDHVVRTAAIELRKRLAIYYGEEKHRSELRLSMMPGSYIPHFALPSQAVHDTDSESSLEIHLPIRVSDSHPDFKVLSHERIVPLPVASHKTAFYIVCAALVALCIAVFFGYRTLHTATAQDLFWRPVLDTPGTVLLVVGDVPNGPPTPSATTKNQQFSIPIVQKASSPTVPFADMLTIARVLGVLESHDEKVLIRQGNSISFSDLREGPVVLIGAFNNEWSLRLTSQLRYTLALDTENHLVYISDEKNPSSRSWSWATDQPIAPIGTAGDPVRQDYALISRIWNSETGHAVIVIGGLYTYGTQSAGEFLTDPQLMQALAKAVPLGDSHRNLQIVLGTTITDDTPGPPRILAVSAE